jgi:hypothetical protein
MKSVLLAACAAALLAAAPLGAQTPGPTPPSGVNPPNPPGGPMIPPDVRRPEDQLRGPSTVPGDLRRPGDTLPAQPKREVTPGASGIPSGRVSETAPNSSAR